LLNALHYPERRHLEAMTVATAGFGANEK
jgi:hypothetical protein